MAGKRSPVWVAGLIRITGSPNARVAEEIEDALIVGGDQQIAIGAPIDGIHTGAVSLVAIDALRICSGAREV